MFRDVVEGVGQCAKVEGDCGGRGEGGGGCRCCAVTPFECGRGGVVLAALTFAESEGVR